ncbi:MAG: hypothetical protein AB1477_03185 [Acidobacteriota bacterium]|jgi:hypothetical protein
MTDQMPDNIRLQLGNEWLPDLYRSRIRSGRTRRFRFTIPNRENRPEILHTLLGIELKVGRRRFSCPDLATARYLRVFARIGCDDIAIPYDISRLSAIADDLETAWQKTNLLMNGLSAAQRRKIINLIREEIREIGPGDEIPEFNTKTRFKRPK